MEKSMAEQMSEIDSLVIQEKYDSAYTSVMRIKSFDLVEPADLAHYYLLLTQTSILTNHTDTAKRLDNFVIPYYNKTQDHEKLAEAYYYKAYEILEAKDFPDAVQWFKKAEEQAILTTNLRLQYKIFENFHTSMRL